MSTVTFIAIVITIAIAVTIADHDRPHPEQPILNYIIKLAESKSVVIPHMYFLVRLCQTLEDIEKIEVLVIFELAVFIHISSGKRALSKIIATNFFRLLGWTGVASLIFADQIGLSDLIPEDVCLPQCECPRGQLFNGEACVAIPLCDDDREGEDREGEDHEGEDHDHEDVGEEGEVLEESGCDQSVTLCYNVLDFYIVHDFKAFLPVK